jgi:DNA-binding beta-propeller fold protein YncE
VKRLVLGSAIVVVGSACLGSSSEREAAAKPSASVAPLVWARSLPLPGVIGEGSDLRLRGRFDHLAYDAVTRRLFVAATANESFEAIDVDRWIHLKSVGGLRHPQGVAVLSAGGRVVVSSGDEGAVRAYDLKTLEPAGSASVGEDPDNLRCVGDRLYVAYGSEKQGAIAVLDAGTFANIGEIPLPAHPESFQLTPDAKRMFVNIPGAKQSVEDGVVCVGDVEKGKVVSVWRLPGASRNFPMALDAPRRRVFVAARRPAKLICLDADSGGVLAEAPCVADADDVFVDPVKDRIIVIGGGDAETGDVAGAVEIFAFEKVGGALVKIATVATGPRARTGLFVPERRAIYVAVPREKDRLAEIREYLLGD